MIDVFCALAFAMVYTSKIPITSVDLLCDRTLSCCEALGVHVKAVLTDTGLAAL